MPRWLFLILVTALALSVVGGVLIVLRSPRQHPPARSRRRHLAGGAGTGCAAGSP